MWAMINLVIEIHDKITVKCIPQDTKIEEVGISLLFLFTQIKTLSVQLKKKEIVKLFS